MLNDTCPCGRRLITIMHQEGCGGCGCRLDQFPLQTLTDQEQEGAHVLTALIWSALGCLDEPFPPRSLPFPDDHPIWHFSPVTLVEFLWYGSHILQRFVPSLWHPILLRQAAVKDVHAQLLALVDVLHEWPERWYTVLERVIEQEGLLPTYGKRLPALLQSRFAGNAWDWLHQTWITFVQERALHDRRLSYWLPAYHAEAQKDDAPFPPDLITQKEATRLLRAGEETIQALIDEGLLHVTHPPLSREEERVWRLVSREDVQWFRVLKEGRLNLAQAAELCGISEASVEALVAEGLLRTEERLIIDGQSVWVFTHATIDTMVDLIIGHVPVLNKADPADDLLTLPEALTILSWSGVRLPHLLRDVQRGVLPAYRTFAPFSIGALRFERARIAWYQCEQQPAIVRSSWSMQRVCEEMQCKATTLHRLRAVGLLLPRQDTEPDLPERWLYDPAAVQAFQEQYVDSDGAATILGITRITVQQWAKAGRLPAVTGPDLDGSHSYRFEKAALIQWRSERVTFGEAMDLLGVSKATLHRWVTQGKLTPLDYMGGKQRWFARADVEAMSAIP